MRSYDNITDIGYLLKRFCFKESSIDSFVLKTISLVEIFARISYEFTLTLCLCSLVTMPQRYVDLVMKDLDGNC